MMMSLDLESILFLLSIFIVALFYSSVGHGGASGYLAVMGLFHFSPIMMRPAALVLNCIVSLIAATQYYRSTIFKKKLFFYLIIASVPAAFLGARIIIDADLYKKILGCILIIPAIRLTGIFKIENRNASDPAPLLLIITGFFIGLLSGIIGIGGGILLSPVLVLMGWATIKETALISAMFIFLNSLAGMAGLLTYGINLNPDVYLWIVIVLVGGYAGSWLGSIKLSGNNLKSVLGIVMLFAGLKLIFQ